MPQLEIGRQVVPGDRRSESNHHIKMVRLCRFRQVGILPQAAGDLSHGQPDLPTGTVADPDEIVRQAHAVRLQRLVHAQV